MSMTRLRDVYLHATLASHRNTEENEIYQTDFILSEDYCVVREVATSSTAVLTRNHCRQSP